MEMRRVLTIIIPILLLLRTFRQTNQQLAKNNTRISDDPAPYIQSIGDRK